MLELQRLVELLGVPFLACGAMTAILGYLGLHVLRREIVFVDIAMAQVVAVGAIGAHLLFDAHDDSVLAYASAFGLSVVAAAFYAFTRRRVLQISTEAVIGVSYAIAAAAALFLLGVAPGGHVHAQHMLAGSILWATWKDLLVSGLAFLAVGICFYLLRRPFERISSDYEGAVREGVRVVWWDFLFYTLIGVVITFAVRIGGVVVVFCLLIIPATIAVLFSRRLLVRLLIAWAAGVSGSLLGLLFADRLDFSVGPSVALLLGAGLVVAGVWRRLPAAAAAGITGIAVVAYVALLATAPVPVDVRDNPCDIGAEFGVGETVAQPPPAAAPEEVESLEDRMERAGGAEGLAEFYEQASDPSSRCDIVLRALDLEPPGGAALALRFLEGDPPLFFRQMVVDRLGEGVEEPPGFDVMRPWADPRNQEAAERLRKAYGL